MAMDEKTFEDIICRYPELIEEGLSLRGRQVTVKGKRVDVLFEDKHGQKLIAEIKKGPVLRHHVGQLMDYEGYFVDEEYPNVRVMLIGNRVPENLRRSLNPHGFEWKELTIRTLERFLAAKEDHELLNLLSTARPHSNDVQESENGRSGFNHQGSPVVHQSFPPVKNVITDNLANDAPIFSLLKQKGYSISEIYNLNRAVLTFNLAVLPRKITREAEAGEMLRQFRGKYTTDILDNIFDKADKDPTGPWFGQMLSQPNRNKIYRCSGTELNRLIDMLLETGDLVWLGRWRRAGNRGMKPGAATLLMYLYSPDVYNIWLPKTHSGLSRLTQLDLKTPDKEMSANDYSINYKRFNEAATTIRKEYGIVPQSMDWLLWAIREIKENPENRFFHAYKDGTTI